MKSTKLQWKPIETAPKDRRIILGFTEPIFTGINVIAGKWDDDKYHKNPQPCWTHDLQHLTNRKELRSNQPGYWMEIPTIPLSDYNIYACKYRTDL